MDDEPLVAGVGMKFALFVTGLATIAIGLFPNFFIKPPPIRCRYPLSGRWSRTF